MVGLGFKADDPQCLGFFLEMTAPDGGGGLYIWVTDEPKRRSLSSVNRSMCSVFQKLHSARVLQGMHTGLGTPAEGEREDLRCPPPPV